MQNSRDNFYDNKLQLVEKNAAFVLQSIKIIASRAAIDIISELNILKAIIAPMNDEIRTLMSTENMNQNKIISSSQQNRKLREILLKKGADALKMIR